MEYTNLRCRKCGAPISADEKKCKKCGAPILLKVMQEEEKRKLSAREIRKKNKRMRSEYKKVTKATEKRENKPKKSVVPALIKWVIAILLVGAMAVVAYNITKNKMINTAVNSNSTNAEEVLEDSQPGTEETEETEEAEEPVAEEPQEITEEETEEAEPEEEPQQAPPKEEPKKQEAPARQITRNNYIFPSDTQKLTEADLNGLTKYDTGLIRNEIFARKGYIFQNEPYKSYFNSQAWYTPTTKTNISLNDIEKYNNDFLIEYEKSQGWR